MGKVREISRTYHFPNKETVTIHRVRNVNVSASQGHRLLDANKRMYYIPDKWLWISIESKHGWEM